MNLHQDGTHQPTHAFGYDRLQEHRIIVRTSLPSETIVTLDGVLRSLEPGTLIIADAAVPVAVAGVMGGLTSSVTAATTRIVFEIAHFDPRAVARASRHLGIKTDANHFLIYEDTYVFGKGYLSSAKQVVPEKYLTFKAQ